MLAWLPAVPTRLPLMTIVPIFVPAMIAPLRIEPPILTEPRVPAAELMVLPSKVPPTLIEWMPSRAATLR
jgi:hypothetical protein